MSLLHAIVGRLPRSWITAVSHAQWKHPLLKRSFDWAARRFQNSDSTIQSGAGKGLRFNAGNANAGYVLGTSEPDTQAILQRLIQPGMVVYDIGANVGYLSMIAARLTGPTGKVICFEPLPANAKRLEHNAALNEFGQVLVRNEAMGRTVGSATFLVSDTPTWGKLASVGALSSEVGRIEVPVQTVDAAVFDQNLPRPDLIKIDVEGAEVDVLAGAARTLREIRPLLLIELHGTNGPVAQSLEEADYQAEVLEGATTVREAPWDAKLLAQPRDRKDAAN